MEIYPFDIPADSKLRVIMDAIIFLHVMQSKLGISEQLSDNHFDETATFTEIDFTNLKLHTNLKKTFEFSSSKCSKMQNVQHLIGTFSEKKNK